MKMQSEDVLRYFRVTALETGNESEAWYWVGDSPNIR